MHKVSEQALELVDVCRYHHEALQKETQEFYNYQITASERVLYQQIMKIKEGKSE